MQYVKNYVIELGIDEDSPLGQEDMIGVVRLPLGAKILHLHRVDDNSPLVATAFIDTDAETVDWNFLVVRSGAMMHRSYGFHQYVGSVIVPTGKFADPYRDWHVFIR